MFVVLGEISGGASFASAKVSLIAGVDVKKQQAQLGSPTPFGDSAAYLPRAADKAELWVNEHRGTSFALVGRSPLDATCLDNNSPLLIYAQRQKIRWLAKHPILIPFVSLIFIIFLK